MKNFSFHILLVILLLLNFACDVSFAQNFYYNYSPPRITHINNYLCYTWQTDSGLPQNTVMDIIQSKDGYIWVGTEAGIARFDGIKFTVFNRQNYPTITSDFNIAITEDLNGNIWFGTSGGGINIFKDGKFSPLTLKDGLNSNFISSIFCDSKNRMWISTIEGLNLYENNELRNFKNHPANNAVPILEDKNKVLWFTSSNKSLILLKEEKYYEYTIDKIFPFLKKNQSITSLLETDNSAIWVGTNSGLYKSILKNGKYIFSKKYLEGLSIKAVHNDLNNNIWVTTFGKGVFCLTDERILQFTKATGFGTDLVGGLCIDNEGQIWIGAYSYGLNKLMENSIHTISKADGLPNEVLFTIASDSQKNLWVGTYGGGAIKIGKNKFTSYNFSNGSGLDIVRSILCDNKDVWIGNRNYGLSKYDGKTFHHFGIKDGLTGRSVYSLYKDAYDTIWVGTENGLNKIVNGKLVPQNKFNPLKGNFIRATIRDNEKNLWVASDGKGLFRVKNNDIKLFTSKNSGLISDFVLCFFIDSRNILYIGTQNGLCFYSGEKFVNLTVNEGLPDNIAYSIIPDNNNCVWISCNKGVYKIHTKDIHNFFDGKINSIHASLYDKSEGMLLAECNGGNQPAAFELKARTGDKSCTQKFSGSDERFEFLEPNSNKILYPSPKGIIIIDPEKVKSASKPPITKIEKIFVEEKEILQENNLILEPSQQRIEIHFTALSFIAPEKLQFKFFLENLDPSWVDAGNRRVAYYNNLPPGKFIFHVASVDNEGNRSLHDATLIIMRKPYFYETTFFYTLCVVAFISLFFVFHHRRVTNIKKKQKELEQTVEQRTESLRIAKGHAEQALKQTEEARNQLIAVNEELEKANHIKIDLLNMAVHDLKNPLNAIRGGTEFLLDSKSNDEDSISLLSMINESAREMLDLINDLLKTSYIEDSNFELILARINLVQVLQESISQLDFLARKKNQTIKLSRPENLFVNADPGRLKEIFDNLISNAVKYSPLNSLITISANEEEGKIVVRFMDEGPGLTENDMKKVFGKFKKLSAKPTGGESSTGLGLSIVKDLVEKHGGSIYVKNEPTKGCSFYVILPCINK